MQNPILIYSKKERWGILSLVMLNLVLLLISFTFTTPKYEFDHQKLLAFQKSVDEIYALHPIEKEVTPVASLYHFDPNKIEFEELLSLGFSKRVAKNMINYRSKGGHFYNAASLQKIYGMDSVFFEKIAPFIDIPEKKWATNYPQKHPSSKVPKPQKASFPFDPNTATKSELLSLGFSKRITNNIINYRNKGGKFYKPESLKKIYGMTDDFYASIADNIQINKAQFTDNQNINYQKETSKTVGMQAKKPKNIWPKGKTLEINSASVEEWDKLPGIGQYFAKNIVRYREKLGGFYDVGQVAEAYRLPDSTFQFIRPFLEVDASKIHRFNPQTADFKTINHHPYITYEQTKYCMKAQKGIRLMSKEDFLTVKIFTKEELERVAPYFLFE
ncbi:MAG TPA: helix-hairpin-helix domain-containing protein [Saprospiraceae bacterium]|nr:helix-hairpin-helix domain-containing protein [Saprospiraceae bacterium]